MQENIYNFMLEIFVDLNLRFAVLNSDNLLFFMKHDMGHVDRTFVLGVWDHLRLKPACSAVETSCHTEILHEESLGIIICREWIKQARDFPN